MRLELRVSWHSGSVGRYLLFVPLGLLLQRHASDVRPDYDVQWRLLQQHPMLSVRQPIVPQRVLHMFKHYLLERHLLCPVFVIRAGVQPDTVLLQSVRCQSGLHDPTVRNRPIRLLLPNRFE